MKSVRLGSEREARLGVAARAEGISESEFIRRAVDRALDGSAFQGSLRERLSDVIGSVRGKGPPVAHRTSEAFEELLAADHTRPSE